LLATWESLLLCVILNEVKSLVVVDKTIRIVMLSVAKHLCAICPVGMIQRKYSRIDSSHAFGMTGQWK